jgi:hypothetical protein
VAVAANAGGSSVHAAATARAQPSSTTGCCSKSDRAAQGTPQVALIRVYLAEGNQLEAVREFGRYRVLLRTELGLEPPRLRRLVQGLQSQ